MPKGRDASFSVRHRTKYRQNEMSLGYTVQAAPSSARARVRAQWEGRRGGVRVDRTQAQALFHGGVVGEVAAVRRPKHVAEAPHQPLLGAQALEDLGGGSARGASDV